MATNRCILMETLHPLQVVAVGLDRQSDVDLLVVPRRVDHPSVVDHRVLLRRVDHLWGVVHPLRGDHLCIGLLQAGDLHLPLLGRLGLLDLGHLPLHPIIKLLGEGLHLQVH